MQYKILFAREKRWFQNIWHIIWNQCLHMIKHMICNNSFAGWAHFVSIRSLSILHLQICLQRTKILRHHTFKIYKILLWEFLRSIRRKNDMNAVSKKFLGPFCPLLCESGSFKVSLTLRYVFREPKYFGIAFLRYNYYFCKNFQGPLAKKTG